MISLVKIRMERRLTQKDLADLLNISRSTVAMWETGRSSPKRKDIKTIAKTLNISVDEILDCFDRYE